ncbi:hypothetical protein CTI12_AA494560 [Artemisia annua]|uniref:Uncharacterized protein n=1 Tax=Artemisia annua TaxID=35608 RepID=A0A2U1LEZ8_ARTAN|nr:hypothetical protein CTI12_AA494560 [Artemisia annua]
MSISKYNEVKNFEVHSNFTLRKLGFIEWIEVHDLTRNLKSKAALKVFSNMSNKFVWVMNITDKLNIPPLPELNQVDLLAPKKKQPSEKKRKRFQLNQVFVIE